MKGYALTLMRRKPAIGDGMGHTLEIRVGRVIDDCYPVTYEQAVLLLALGSTIAWAGRIVGSALGTTDRTTLDHEYEKCGTRIFFDLGAL